jgi:hypothetical protein
MVCFGRIFDVRIVGSKSLRVVVLSTVLLLVLLSLGLLLFVELALVLLVLRNARSMGFVAVTRKTAPISVRSCTIVDMYLLCHAIQACERGSIALLDMAHQTFLRQHISTPLLRS